MEIADYIVAEDRRLVELVLEGDDTAFEYLFNRYRDAIHRLFVQRLGGVNDADDLLQETFIKVYINLHRYSADYTFEQWVYTIARNTFIDFVRRRQDDLSIDEPLNVDYDGNELLLSDVLGTDDDVVNKGIETEAEREILRGAVSELCDREREIMEMRFGLIDGKEKTQKEVAEIIGISQSYISRLEKKIIKKLRLKLESIT